MIEAALRKALVCGAPTWAFERLCAATGMSSTRLRARLRHSGFRWFLNEPHLSAAREHGFNATQLEPTAGVYALGAASFPTGDSVGVVRALRALNSREPTNDEFQHAVNDGLDAAFAWVCDSIGVVPSCAPSGVADQRFGQWASLQCDESLYEQSGASAGLAVALAAATKILGASQRHPYVSATGLLSGNQVHHVESLRSKLKGVAREAPWITVVFVPESQRDEVTKEFSFEVVPVASVPEALQYLWPEVRPEDIPHLSLVDAAAKARLAEVQKNRLTAASLSRVVLSRLDRVADPATRVMVEFPARSTHAMALLHRGKAKEAETEFQKCRELASVTTGFGDRLIGLDDLVEFSGQIASMTIDRLDASRSLAYLDSVAEHLGLAGRRPKIVWRGTRCRALTALGRIDEAREESDRQLALVGDDQNELGLTLSNAVDLELWAAERGRPYQPERAAEMLRRYGELAEGQTGESGELSRRHYRLRRVRWAAINGDAAHALELALESDAVDASNAYPVLYAWRFVGRAFRQLGESEKAVGVWKDMIARIPAEVVGFVRVVLHTADAELALTMIESGDDEWLEHGKKFSRLYTEHISAERVEPEADSASDWKEMLEQALFHLPY